MARVFNRTLRHWKKVLRKIVGEEDISNLIDCAREELLTIATRLPDIGGKLNPLDANIIESTVMLAYYKTLKERNMNVEEIGAITHDVIRERVQSFPSIMLRLRGAYLTSRYYQKRKRKSAARSQQKKYPGDWIYYFVEGDGKTFHYGIDYTECGICKLFKDEEAQEFTPFLCDIDYITFGAFGIGFAPYKNVGKG